MTDTNTKWFRLHPAPRQDQSIYQYVYDWDYIMSDDVVVVDGYLDLPKWIQDISEDLGEFEWSDGRLIRLMRLTNSKMLLFVQLWGVLDKHHELKDIWT